MITILFSYSGKKSLYKCVGNLFKKEFVKYKV